ncbi:nuclear transport factor 2 family protein [Nocardia altamirensis]|uniref:nuclear transport factor 2 family protein n=1 Tax=Nocardia altamirensis TaxID=472158 RepID=UPI000A03317B|nr:nuclear transport factor 2 family protein [Nocardia altamirensis]
MERRDLLLSFMLLATTATITGCETPDSEANSLATRLENAMYTETVEKWRAALVAGDIDTVVSYLSPDVHLYSPLKATVIGRQEVDHGFVATIRSAFPPDLRFTGHLSGTAEDRDGNPKETHVLPFRSGPDYGGVLTLQFDNQGRIDAVAVYSTLRALTAAIGPILDQAVIALQSPR